MFCIEFDKIPGCWRNPYCPVWPGLARVCSKASAKPTRVYAMLPVFSNPENIRGQ